MRERLPLVLSATALTVALLGATPIGEAASSLVIPRASVGTPQLKSAAVTTSKLKKNAVTTLKVRDSSLLAIDFAPNQLPAGQKGDKGDKGDPGLAQVQVVTRTVTAPANSYAGESAQCPEGKRPIAGGGSAGGLVFIQSTSPTGTGWLTRWRNTSGVAQNVTTYAVCATVLP